MTGRKKIGLFLVVAGALLLVASGLVWKRQGPEVQELNAQKAMLADSLTRVHAKLVQTSLKSRALHESQSQIPDTLKMTGAGQMMAQGEVYNKMIRKAEFTERDIKIEMAAVDRKMTSVRNKARATALPAAVGGGVALLVGLVLTALPSRRVGA